MLSFEEKGRPTASRVKGKPAIIRSLRGLLIRVHRFGNRRARTSEDLTFAAVMIDMLTDVLRVAERPDPGGGV